VSERAFPSRDVERARRLVDLDREPAERLVPRMELRQERASLVRIRDLAVRAPTGIHGVG